MTKKYTIEEKEQLLEQWKKLQESGFSMSKSASKVNVHVSTLQSWEKSDNLDPAKGGRPKAIEFSEYELALARWFRLAKESLDVAASFLARDERVRAEISEALIGYEEKAEEKGSRINWPQSVRRAFHVTAEEKASFRGKKAAQQTEMITRRGMFEVLADGSIAPILPGNTWELDDYSTNQPFTYMHPETQELMLGRQVLAARDLAAAKWLGFDHIGRERDAYRAEDIVRFIERLVRSHGLPHRLRLERGSWESAGVHGIEVPGMTNRWGDLRDLMEIEHVFKSKSKAIVEGGFNVLQRWLGHTGTDIGRTRGEFEEATKRYLKARKANVDPRTLGFLTQEKSSKAHMVAAETINSRPMMRSHLNERVSPDDLVARQGWHTEQLSEADAWYFLPCKQVRIVRAGHVEVNPGGGWPKMTFTVNGNGEDIHLENGHKILVACDPQRPDLGAYLCNADQTVKNREGYGMAEFLMTAPYFGLAPQFNAAAELSPQLVARKKAAAAASTTFRSIKNAARSTGAHESTVTNGKNKTASIGNIEREQTTANKPAAQETVERSPAPQPQRREPAEPVKMSRHSGRDTAAEIAKLTAALED